MVGTTPPPPGMSVNEVQTRLLTTGDRWLIEQDGHLTVRLSELATIVRELTEELAERLIDYRVGARYRTLAAAIRRSTSPQTAAVLNRWADAVDRRADALHALSAQAPRIYPVELTSFGYLHGDAPDAELVVDVRDTLRDPAAARDILDLDGRDPRVKKIVMATPGAADLLDDLITYADRAHADQPRRIAIGCAGGRHRSVALIEVTAVMLRDYGIPVIVRHRDIHRPRVLHPGGEQA